MSETITLLQPDEYRSMVPELVRLLKEQLKPILEEYRTGLNSHA